MSTTGRTTNFAGTATGGGRKLIAVVYADMVGYSRLIGEDDAGTLRRLRTLRRALIDPAIREHGGRVVQTGGDSLLVAFDSIDGAVRCAVKVQQQVPVYDGDQQPARRIRFRIGINIGDVIAEGTNLHGDGVNIAARLEAASPVGGICVSRTVRDHVHGRLDLAFEPIGELRLKNIARAVEAFVVRLDPGAEVLMPEVVQSEHASLRVRALAAILAGVVGLLLVAVAGAGWWLYRGTIVTQKTPEVAQAADVRPASPPATARTLTPPNAGVSKAPRLSIVVLPLENLSGDARDDYLVDGITDDLTSDLSLIAGSFVIARQSAYTYKGKREDVRKIGEELGVRYVLEGSVRRIETTLRVNVQLTSAESGAHLWSDRFDEQITQLAVGQEQVVTRMRAGLNISLVEIEKARSLRERPTNPDAFDLLLRGRALYNQPPNVQRHLEAQALFERALLLDPSSASALSEVVLCLIERADNRGGWENLETMQRVEQLVAEARAVAPESRQPLGATFQWLRTLGRCREGIPVAEQLIQRFPNYALGYAYLASCKYLTGHAEQVLPLEAKAMQLNPRDPNLFVRYLQMGIATLLLGRDQDAITFLEQSLAVEGDYGGSKGRINRLLAAAYARTGRMEEAKRSLSEADRLFPYDTVRSHYPDDPSSSVLAEQMRGFQAGLRLAGERDHADEDADFGVSSDRELHGSPVGRTPKDAPGTKTIRTEDLARLLAAAQPVVVDTATYSWGRSIPGAIGLKYAGIGDSFVDAAQDHLRRKVHELTAGDLNRPVVAVGWNSERFDGRNLALRLAALGYANVYWYRGGGEAWEVAGLPETELVMQEW